MKNTFPIVAVYHRCHWTRGRQHSNVVLALMSMVTLTVRPAGSVDGSMRARWGRRWRGRGHRMGCMVDLSVSYLSVTCDRNGKGRGHLIVALAAPTFASHCTQCVPGNCNYCGSMAATRLTFRTGRRDRTSPERV